MKNDPKLLHAMISDQDKQSKLYRPGEYWRGYQQRVINAIDKYGVENFRKHPEIGKGYADTITKNPLQLIEDPHTLKNKLITLLVKLPKVKTVFGLYDHLISHYIETGLYYKSYYYQSHYGSWFEEMLKHYTIPDTLHGGSEDVISFNGTKYATLYINFLMRIHNFSKYAKLDQIKTVMEIGGGFGAWPHLMLTLYPNIKKLIYLDIPPMIYIATQYFKHHFGDSVIDYQQTSSQSTIRFSDTNDLEILCLCPWQIENLDVKAELLWNTASFSEMTPEIVNNYASHFTKNCTDQSNICLILNKTEPHPNHLITLPNEVMGFFEGEFQFQQVVPEIELLQYSQYWFGTHR